MVVGRKGVGEVVWVEYARKYECKLHMQAAYLCKNTHMLGFKFKLQVCHKKQNMLKWTFFEGKSLILIVALIG